MRDSARSDSGRGLGNVGRVKLGVLLLLAAVLAVGLTIGGASVVGTSAPSEGTSSDQATIDDEDAGDDEVAADEATGDDEDAVAITGECVDGTGTLAVENPTATAATVTMNWSVEQSRIELLVESENATQSIVLGGATVDAEQEVSIDGAERTVAVEFEPGLLNVTVPAEEELTVAGLVDDTYEFSASADGTDAPIEPETVTVDCETSDATAGNETEEPIDE